MAIFKYKKSNGSGGYSIEEMPVISNTYTEYVVAEDISQDPQIVLKPSQTSFNINEQKTFNKVTASINLLSTTPTYEYNINDRNKTITFNSTEWKTTMGYGDKFPPGITISIPSDRWLNKNTDSSGNLNIELTPTVTSSSVTAGYYTGGTISVKTLTTNPTYTPSTSQQTITYDANGFPNGITINAIQTTALTLNNNNTTYTIGTGSWTAGTYPTSITVEVPNNGIDTSNATARTTLYNNRDKIPKNYVVYGSGSSSSVTGTMELYTHTSATTSNLTSQGATRTIEAGYHDGNETIKVQLPEITTSGTIYLKPKTKTSQSISVGYYSNGFTVYPSTQTLTSTNPSLTYNSSTGYYEKSYEPTTSTSSSTVWGDKYLTKFTLQLASNTSSKIVSGQSVCGISGAHVCPSAPSIDVSEIYPKLNSLYNTTEASSLVIPITRWRNNVLLKMSYAQTDSSVFSESDWVDPPYYVQGGSFNTMLDYLNYNDVDGYITYNSYSSYMEALNFPTSFQTIIPPYGFAWMICNYNHVFEIYCQSAISKICPYAFWGANISKLLITTTGSTIIQSGSFAGFRINKTEFRGPFSINANIFEDPYDSGSNTGYIYQLTINANSSTLNTYIHPQAFNSRYPSHIYIYGSSNLNMSDQPWGATNASVYIRS